MKKFEFTYEWAGSSGSVLMSTDIVTAVDEVKAREKFAQRHDGDRHRILEVRHVGSTDS